MLKYGVISGPYFPVFGLNTDIYYVPKITPYLDAFQALHPALNEQKGSKELALFRTGVI